MRYETAEISLLGDRDQNQDRVAIAKRRRAVLLSVVDGMGGHSDGERAAEAAVASLVSDFKIAPADFDDPAAILTSLILRAHDAVVALGTQLTSEDKPRATCAVCLVVDRTAWWAHVGDARVYVVSGGEVVYRTRDHSHVEVLLREGLIREDEVQGHPMRHYVECCLGGESALPDLSNPGSHAMAPGDVILVCSDGLWSGVTDEVIGSSCDGRTMKDWLVGMSERATEACAPYGDNTTAAALRLAGK